MLEAADRERRGEVVETQLNGFGVGLGQIVGEAVPAALSAFLFFFKPPDRLEPRFMIIDFPDYLKLIYLCDLHQLVKAFLGFFEGEDVGVRKVQDGIPPLPEHPLNA